MEQNPSPSTDDKPQSAADRGSFVPIRREPFQCPNTVMSASLDTRIKGFLSVRITFLGEPVKDLTVQFFHLNGSKVDPIAPEIFELFKESVPGFQFYGDIESTDDEGRYSIPFLVPVDYYLCRIEYQPDALVSTVEIASKPFEIVLPVGRPYHDFYLDTFLGPSLKATK